MKGGENAMLQFSDRDSMTAEQVVANNAAKKYLVRGKYYCFKPPVTAVAIPIGGPNTCALKKCTFERGWYIGMKDGNHIFQGKPVNDQRVIFVPRGYKDALNVDEILEQLRDSYFTVLFIGGSAAVLDANQGHLTTD